jgi:hypothetical protein
LTNLRQIFGFLGDFTKWNRSVKANTYISFGLTP